MSILIDEMMVRPVVYDVEPKDTLLIKREKYNSITQQRVYDPLSIDSSLLVSGAVGARSLNTIQDIRTVATPAWAGITVGDTLILGSGSITDTGGAINFGNEALSTTGSITGNSLITASDIGIAGDTDIIQLTGANTMLVNGTLQVNKLGIGTATIPHGGVGAADFAIDGVSPSIQITTTTDDYPIFQMTAISHDSCGWSFDAYYDATNWRSSDAGSNFLMYKLGDRLIIRHPQALVAAGNIITWSSAAFATYWDATGVFFYKPNKDAVATLGKARIGYMGVNDYAGFSHYDVAATGSYALLQDSTGKTFLNAANTKTVYFKINNVTKMDMNTTRLNSKIEIQIDSDTNGLVLGDLQASKIHDSGTWMTYDADLNSTGGKGFYFINGNMGVGAAPVAAAKLWVEAPDAQSAIYIGIKGKTLSDATINYGVAGEATGDGGTTNVGVRGVAGGATNNYHFQSLDGDECSGGAWNDSSSRKYKTNIKTLSTKKSEWLYNQIDNIHIKSYFHNAEKHYKNQQMRFTGIAEEMPDFLASHNKKSISGGRVAAFAIHCIQHHKNDISINKNDISINKIEISHCKEEIKKLDKCYNLFKQIKESTEDKEQEEKKDV